MVFKYEEQEYEIDFEYIQEIFTHKNQVKSGKSKETVCFLIKSIDFKFIGAGHPSRQADGLTKYPVYGWALPMLLIPGLFIAFGHGQENQ